MTTQLITTLGSLLIAVGTVVGAVSTWRSAKKTGNKTDAEVWEAMIEQLRKQIAFNDEQHQKATAEIRSQVEEQGQALQKERDERHKMAGRLARAERKDEIWWAWYHSLVVNWDQLRAEVMAPEAPRHEEVIYHDGP